MSRLSMDITRIVPKCRSSKYTIAFFVVCVLSLLYVTLHVTLKDPWSTKPMMKGQQGQQAGITSGRVSKRIKVAPKDAVPDSVQTKDLLWNLMNAGPFTFLPNFKNPCWYNPKSWNDTKQLHVLCLPYFYLIGAPKAGTTDMTRRLYRHPQISSKVVKDSQWLTKTKYTSSVRNLSDYQNKFLTKATKEVIRRHDSLRRHDVVFGDCSADVLWNTRHLSSSRKPNVTTADVLHHLNPKVKIIVLLRNPVDRLYSDFLYFHHGTPQEFHDIAVQPEIPILEDCFKKDSARECLYSMSHPDNKYLRRMGIGLYSVHLKEWFRVFPRDQIMVIKLEDFSTNMASYMKKVFSFLDLAPVSYRLLQKISNPNRKVNSRTKEDTKVGEMLPKTRRILQEFYRPFNNELVKLLGKSFNYNT